MLHSQHIKKAVTLLLLFVSFSTNAAITINEVMPCNLSTIINTDNYNFSGYIEFANDQSTDVNLKGYTLVHFKKGSNGYSEKWTWQIKDDLILTGGKFTLLWVDESKKAYHVPYKLDADGGYLVLKNGEHRIDSLAYDAQTAHLSYGRYGNFTGFMEPSPKAANTMAFTKATRCKAPVFSVKGGLMTGTFTLTLSCPTAGATIYYTTDGTEPNTSSSVYKNSAITINKSTNIRARAYYNGLLPSTIVTNSYIYAEKDHGGCGGVTIPVVSLTVDDRYFNDDKIGMCVIGSNGTNGDKSCTQARANYNNDWKRPVNFEYFVNGNQVMSQEVEAAVEGGCSRGEARKSLSLKASKKTGDKDLGYHFFSDKPNITHQTVHVRNGGTAYSKVKFRDGLMQTFATTMNIDYQAYQPVAYYINGKYTGLMALMERTNADYIKANYDIDEDDIDLITVSDQKGISASKGTLDAYNELNNYLQTKDSKSQEFYDWACKHMDMDEYIDYQVFQQFIVNSDWPGNNTKIWRERKTGSRFRWILFDTDFGFGLPGYNDICYSSKNMIKWCRGEGLVKWANESKWMTSIFKNLSDNPQFSKKFTTKFLIHLSTTFSDERINSVFDKVTKMVEAEYCADVNKSAKEDTRSMREFALERASTILKNLKSYTVSGDAVNFELKSNIKGAHFCINGETVESFKGNYLSNFSTDFKAYPPVGYKFDHWKIEGGFNTTSKKEECITNLPGELSGSLTSQCTITAVFTAQTPNTTLVINELCASSDKTSGNADEYGKYPDWIEVYNYGNEPIDMAGMYFSTKKGNLQLNSIAYGSESTIINSKEHKLFWANSDPVDGALHLNFNLNVDKPKTIYLSNAAGTIISQGAYETHDTNESFGYEKDNFGDWMLFAVCDQVSATPGKENGTIMCSKTAFGDSTLVEPVVLYPNPAVHDVTISARTIMQEVSIFDVNGRLLQRHTPLKAHYTLDLGRISNGIYIVQINCAEGVYNKKLVKN